MGIAFTEINPDSLPVLDAWANPTAEIDCCRLRPLEKTSYGHSTHNPLCRSGVRRLKGGPT
jgi:hypothetical protein